MEDEGEGSGEPRRPITSQFLLNKYQRQQESSRFREEMMRRHEDHWRCPFFIHYWESNLRLPSADNCPKCNSPYRNNRPFRRSCSRDGRPEPISRNWREQEDQRPSVRDRLGGRSDRYDRLEDRHERNDRLGGRFDRRDQPEARTNRYNQPEDRVSAHDRLEEMADARVSDENPLGCEPEWERAKPSAKPVNPRWCPDGLTKSQK
uniref:Uncharacterized protein n=1 Tax=Setaria viridis TaxID=4556 RepID=A0A4U6U654_SETVI|nr:hypothetical protein SEVIR_6G133608v2 [Setaria viridis]